MSAASLSAALAAMGVRCAVEDQGKLAVLIPTGDVAIGSSIRRAIVSLARTHGFKNVCVELEPVHATLSGD